MNPVVIKIAKNVGKLVVTIGIPALSNYLSDKALDAKIAKKIAEAVKK